MSRDPRVSEGPNTKFVVDKISSSENHGTPIVVKWIVFGGLAIGER